MLRKIAFAVAMCVAFGWADVDAQNASKTPIYDFKMKALDGKTVDFSSYKGKVLLIVNVASQCGFTPQYKGLQALHKKYASKGLVILGFPCNNFGSQEPGTDAEIAKFCKSKYSVDFQMFSKVDVKGKNKCGLYKYLTSKKTNPKHGSEIRWNFEKFLITKKGAVAGHYRSTVKPNGTKFVKTIEKLLNAK